VGSVYFDRHKGRWVAKVVRKDLTAKASAPSREEAEALLPLLEAQIGLRAPEWTLEDAFQEMLRGPLKELTKAHYQELWDRYFLPWGRWKLSDLTPQDASRVLEQAEGTRTRLKVYALGHRLFQLAQRRGLSVENPFQRVPRPSYQAPKPRLWTLEEIQRFLQALQGHRYEALFTLLLLTGMRLGEALALDWAQVDLTRGQITVSRTLTKRRGSWFWSTPKTQAGFRTLPLPKAAQEALRSLGPKPSGLVFQERGEPIPYWRPAHCLRYLCRRAEVPRLSPHQLRHLHASLLLQHGLTIPEVSAHLGHANPRITLQVYSHLLPGSSRVAQVLESIPLSPVPPGPA
jgi:integrase